jgi:hypothetical protein
MSTVELITALFCEADEQLHTLPKHPETRAGGRAGQERPPPHFTTILQHFYGAFMTRYHTPSILLGGGPSQRSRLRAAGLPWSEQGARAAGRVPQTCG